MTATSSLLGDALAAIEEARGHGFCVEAALLAALDHLQLADRAEAVQIAAVLAAWIACDLNPARRTDLAQWLDAAAAVVRPGGAS